MSEQQQQKIVGKQFLLSRREKNGNDVQLGQPQKSILTLSC